MTDFESSTQAIPETAEVPRHVAIIMDGNGRWAKKRFLPRVGGRCDILQAANRCREEDPQAPITEARLSRFLSMSYAPEPDLFIRTGGEQRVSNFLLWQLAYTEFYFTDALWPDFGAQALEEAFVSYRRRERRFGRTSEQLTAD